MTPVGSFLLEIMLKKVKTGACAGSIITVNFRSRKQAGCKLARINILNYE